MKVKAPRIEWTEKPNGTIVTWYVGKARYNMLVSYTTPICTAIVRGGDTKWYRHPSNHPKARSRTTMTHFNEFVSWMGCVKGSVVLDDLPEAEVV